MGILMGAVDRIIGNKFGLGAKFEEGFNAMGPLALGMVGIITLAPLISKEIVQSETASFIVTKAKA